jgi:outer membrane protein assembly factor BamB
LTERFYRWSTLFWQVGLEVVKKTARALFMAFFIVAFAVSSLVIFQWEISGFAQSVGVGDEWSMFRHDLQRTGYSTSTAPNTNAVKWFHNTTTEIDSAPAVADGRVIVGVSNGNVLAVNSTTGEWLWSYDTGAGSNSIWSSPAIAAGRVYIGTRDTNLYCLNASTGLLLWKYATGNQIDSAPLVSEGKVFFGSQDGKLYCLDAASGSFVWSYTTAGDSYGNIGIHSSPAILGNSVFVCSVYGANLYAIDASTGTMIWNYSVTGTIDSTPAVSGGHVFFTSSGAKVYCVGASDGGLVWNTTVSGGMFVRSSPAVANGKLFVGTGDGEFYCLDAATGSVEWTMINIAGVWSSPAVADGKVFFGTEDGMFYCLDEGTGDQIWSYRALERVASSPAVSGGTVFVGCGSGFLGVGGLYAFGEKYSLPTSLSLFLDSDTAVLGFKVRINGTLIGDGNPVSGASVLLSYSVTGGQTWNDITAVLTSADGGYSAVWQPSATGTYMVRASWSPYYPYEFAESVRMLSVNTFDEETVFSVFSNSTVSALAFNSTSKELSFTVSGPDRTLGFVDVGIAKSVVNDAAGILVYLDDVALNYDVTSTADSWRLYFTYEHSTHSVVMNLGNTTVPGDSGLEPFSAFLVVAVIITVLVVVAVGLSVYFKKHKR